MKPTSMKNRSRNLIKNDAQKQSPKNETILQTSPQNWTQRVTLFWGFCLLWRSGGSNRFCDQKVAPQRSQSAPKDRKMSQKWHKRTPRVRKWAPKVDLFRSQAKMSSKSGPFGIQARRTARSAYNYSIQQVPNRTFENLQPIFGTQTPTTFWWQNKQAIGQWRQRTRASPTSRWKCGICWTECQPVQQDFRNYLANLFDSWPIIYP